PTYPVPPVTRIRTASDPSLLCEIDRTGGGPGGLSAAAQYQQAVAAKQLRGKIQRYCLYTGADKVCESRLSPPSFLRFLRQLGVLSRDDAISRILERRQRSGAREIVQMTDLPA